MLKSTFQKRNTNREKIKRVQNNYFYITAHIGDKCF